MIPASDKLSDRSYERLAGLIHSQIGIRMPDTKRMMVEGRLRKRVRVLGMPGVEAYCRHLFEENGLDAELVHVIDAITTNKTDFFREPEHFKFLRETALPQFLADRRGGKPLIKLWSSACSNGAEPYTIAMVMAKAATAVPKYDYAILGTDICTEVLDHAERAVYSEEMIAGVPPDMQDYVMRSRNPARKEYRIVPELRRLVSYQRLNLMDAAYRIDRDVDAIFCRNVLIYFDKPTQQAVLERLRSHLRPGGYLFLGHSESMAGTSLRMKQVAPTVFVRP
jgi:chemotaxis protein methyltransferase CheR